MKVLVTGASGFIGSRVVRNALERGYDVVAAVRSRARASRLEGLSGPLRVVEADLADAGSVRRLLVGEATDLALHLAWSLLPDYDSAENLACVGGSLTLLRGLVESGCPRIVFVGTHHELAPSDGDLGEDAAVAPGNLYAVCKDAVHRTARVYTANTDASFVWARLFNVYGPGQEDWALVSHVVRRLLEGRPCPLTNGDQVRVFVHVGDAADALLAVGLSPLRGIVHIGSADITTVRDLALRIGDLLGRSDLLSFGEIPARAGDARRIVSSNDRLYAEVGFQPGWSLDEGLADTIAWWKSRLPMEVAT